jgi:3-methyladenine DNA glycosylase AlkD
MTRKEIEKTLRQLGNPEVAAFLAGYFKTGPGEYAAGDVFVGVNVPAVRELVQAHKALPVEVVESWLASAIHEVRLLALLILVKRFPRAKQEQREAIVRMYLRQTARINNWDLVDCSAGHILGAWLFDRDRQLLDRLAGSEMLWERRIAIIATAWFIRRGEFHDTLRLAEMLLEDEESLMHKATGWMLREVGNRDLATLLGFLDKHATAMPRTMLGYAIEKLPEKERLAYLKRK